MNNFSYFINISLQTTHEISHKLVNQGSEGGKSYPKDTQSITEPRHRNQENTNSTLLSSTQKCHKAQTHKAHHLWHVMYKNNYKIKWAECLKGNRKDNESERKKLLLHFHYFRVYNCRNYEFYLSKYPQKLLIAKMLDSYTKSPKTWAHYAKWEKSNRERQVLSDITYMWNLKQSNPLKKNREQVVVTRGGEVG